MSFPARLLRSPPGLLIPDDAGTVSHVSFPGRVLDKYGNAWTVNGSPTFTARQGRTPPGISGLTDSAYPSLGTGNDVLDFAGDFSMCLVLAPLAGDISGAKVPFSNGTFNTDGWFIQGTGATGLKITASTTGSSAVASANTAVASFPNAFCAGRSGTTLYAKLNLGTLVTTAGSTITSATTTSAKLGRYAGAGVSFGGTIYEAWFSTTTPSDALFIAIMQRVKARAGISAW